jgi:uncharacterized phiE125 gp8 family phage protein
MSVTVVSVDREELPDSLLAMAKSHLRVDHSFDDDYIRMTIARAIGRLESIYEVSINPSVVEWSPSVTAFDGTGATIPVRVVSSFTATDGIGDVSDDYYIDLKWGGIYGIPIQTLVGSGFDGLVVTLNIGFDDETLPFQLLDVILRHTSHLYENREILANDKPYVAPDLQYDATWWMPRA